MKSTHSFSNTQATQLPKMQIPAELSATKADGSPELTLALSDGGIVKGELFTVLHPAHGVDCNGETPPTSHHLGLAVGAAAVTHPAGKGPLQSAKTWTVLSALHKNAHLPVSIGQIFQMKCTQSWNV